MTISLLNNTIISLLYLLDSFPHFIVGPPKTCQQCILQDLNGWTCHMCSVL